MHVCQAGLKAARKTRFPATITRPSTADPNVQGPGAAPRSQSFARKSAGLAGGLILALALILSPNPAQADFHACVAPSSPPAPQATFLRSYRPDVSSPARLAIDSQDRIYISDAPRAQVVVRDLEGRVLERVTGLGNPVSLAIDDDAAGGRRILVGDASQGRVTAYDGAWQPLFTLGQGDGEFVYPGDITIDPLQGRIYVADSQADLIKVYDTVGQPLFAFGGHGEDFGFFRFPAALHFDPLAGELLVVDAQNFRVQIFDPEGIFVCSFGNLAGSNPGSIFGINNRLFTTPGGIWADGLGRIYVTDSAQGWIQVVDRAGTALGRIGSFGRAPGELSVPLDLLGDSGGRLFVGLGGSARLEVFGLDTFVDPESIAPAVVKVSPNPFDRMSPIAEFTAVVEIPGFDLAPIDLASISANGVAALAESMELGDFDSDGRPDFRIDFPGDALAATFPATGGARVTVHGLLPETDFEGWDDVSFLDGDGDGVPDDVDLCLDSQAGQPVNAEGCSILQLCPCSGPLAGGTWRNHGAFVACRAQAARDFAAQGLIGRSEINVYVREAAAATCGGEGS
jgi:sugar lactone lactonase YvrE